jgi:hypothetical protein
MMCRATQLSAIPHDVTTVYQIYYTVSRKPPKTGNGKYVNDIHFPCVPFELDDDDDDNNDDGDDDDDALVPALDWAPDLKMSH